MRTELKFMDEELEKINNRIHEENVESEEAMDELNAYLNNETLAGLPLADYELLEDLLKTLREKIKDERKAGLDVAKANAIDSSIKALTARINLYSQRRMSDYETVRVEASVLKSKFDDLTDDIEKLQKQAVELLYVSGEEVTPGVKNYDFRVEEKWSLFTSDIKRIYPKPDLVIEKLYVTEYDAEFFASSRKDLLAARSNPEKRAEASAKFITAFERLQILVAERNKVKNSLIAANEKMEKMALGGHTEGYAADVVVTEAPLPKAKDENAKIKGIHDSLLSDFQSVMGSVTTFEDLMKLYNYEAEELLANLKKLNVTKEGKISFEDRINEARALVGNSEAREILKDIEYINKAYMDTRHIVKQIIEFKKESVARINVGLDAARNDLITVNEERMKKEEEVLKIRYILGLVDERELTRYSKRTGRREITVSEEEKRDRQRIIDGNEALRTNYATELANNEAKLAELTTKTNDLKASIESREQAVKNIEEGVLNGRFEAIIKNNPNIFIGTRRLEELRTGYSRETDLYEVLNTESMGHVLGEEASKPKKPRKSKKGSESSKDGEVEMPPELSKEEEEVEMPPELSKDDSLDSRGDKSKEEEKGSTKGRKRGERLKPRKIGKLPKALLAFMAAAGLLVGGVLVGVHLFTPGALQLVTAGFIADRAISSLGSKK